MGSGFLADFSLEDTDDIFFVMKSQFEAEVVKENLKFSILMGVPHLSLFLLGFVVAHFFQFLLDFSLVFFLNFNELSLKFFKSIFFLKIDNF